MWIFCIQKGEKLSNFKGSKTWRLILLFSVFAMVVVACGGDTAEESVDETPETTEAPATTAAAAEQAPSGPDGVYKIAIFSDPQTNNYWPSLDTENDVWTSYVMSGQAVSLFSLSIPNYQLVVGMAEELVETNTANADGTFTYTVPVREGYTWSDGNPITAHDWVFTWNTVKNLGLGGNWLFYYPSTCEKDDPENEGEVIATNCITDIVAVDDYTVSITFNYDPGLSTWQYGTAQAPALSKAYWEQYATDIETLYKHDAINAPVADAFVYDKLETGAFYTWKYDSNTMWYGGTATIYDGGGTSFEWDNGVAPAFSGSFGNTTGDSFSYENGPFVGTVEYTLYSDQDAAYLAFQNGEVDFVLNPLGVKRSLFNTLATVPGVEIVQNMPLGMRYFAHNTRLFPGSDKAFRNAVACIVDRDFIINSVLQGTVERMDGTISSALTAWAPELSGTLLDCQDLDSVGKWEKAVSILQEGGWTADDWGSHPGNETRANPPTGIKGPNGEVPPADMLIYAPGPGYDPLRNTFSLFIADYIRQLGFDVTARPTGFSVIVDILYADCDEQDWNFYMLGWSVGIYPNSAVNFHHSKNDSCPEGGGAGGQNFTGFNSPEFDAVADKFDAAKTVEEAIVLSNQMEAILFDELPYLVLFNPPVLEVYQDSIEFPFTEVIGGLVDACGSCSGIIKSN